VEWQAHDDRPIAEPSVDESGDHLIRDGLWSMTTYQLHKILPAVGRSLHVVDRREAANVNALDEVPDSTWFTNRHPRRPMSPAELARGPSDPRHAPAAGPLSVLSAKAIGMTAGFVVQDRKGDRYVVKLDPPDYPEVPTGAEMVCTKIVYALGWNVPENYLVHLDPERLTLAPDATLTDAELQRLLQRAARGPDGRLRVVASRWLPGKVKGGFRTTGRRYDDPDDRVAHEDRRELRGLRVVAAWINYTDARRGNFLDAFVPDEEYEDGRGHLVHYLLDFSSALGAGNDDWKPPRYGHEYFFDPAHVLWRVATLGLVTPAWAHLPLAHPALGYFDATAFDPEAWRTTYPNPLFDAATVRDAFWGAKLVSAFSDADLAVVARAGEWSDPQAAVILADRLRERQRRIARVYFDWHRIAPLDDFVLDERDRLGFRDLAVENGVAARGDARYRRRVWQGPWEATTSGAALPVGAEPVVVELAVSHDRGASWSPPVRVGFDFDWTGTRVTSTVERTTR
ncbi:MAG: hypothetical protein ABIR79_04070, partial [Candidatus Binatia bacterium]